MIWLVIGYLAFSYGLLGYLHSREPHGTEEGDAGREPASGPGRAELSGFVFKALDFLVIGPLLPFQIARNLWIEWKDERLRGALRRRYREAVMQVLPFDRMHPAGQAMASRFEKRIEALGFRAVTTYLYKPQPFLIESCYHLSGNGRTMLAVGHVNGNGFYSFSSILNGGAGVESMIGDDPSGFEHINATGHYHAQVIPWESFEDVAGAFAEHERFLKELCREKGEDVIVMRHDQVAEAARYLNRRFAAVLFRLGDLDEAPPPADPSAFACPNPER